MIEKSQPQHHEKAPEIFAISDFDSKTELTDKELEEKVDYENEIYNPFANRPVEHSNSTLGSLVHLLKSSLGTGILAMPMAFKNAGLVFGAVGTIIVGIICTHCVHILVRTSHNVCKIVKKPSLGFADTAGQVFATGPQGLRKYSKFAAQFVDFALMATYFSSACVYIVFIAESFHNVIEFHTKIGWDVRVYVVFIIIPLIFIGQIRQLRYLVPFSAIANVLIIVTFAITLYYMFNDKLEFDDKPMVARVEQIPLFFSTVIFAMEGIGAVMPVENSMRKPQHFLGCPGVLNTAMITVIALYAIVGFFGFVKYGDIVKGSITLNLTQGEVLADIAKLLMALAILFTYGLQFYVPMEILWRKIKNKISKDKHSKVQYILRTIVVIATGGVAAAVPNLEAFISLVGAVFFSILGLFVPAVVETVYKYPNLGRGKWILWKNMCLAVFAIFALISGSTISIMEIIKVYTNPSGPAHRLE